MSSLYYEAHITIDPVFDERRAEAERLASIHSFRLAKLIMRKHEADEERPAQDDTFMTGTDCYMNVLLDNMIRLITELKSYGFVVRRYKLEDIIVDSRKCDKYKLL